MNDESAFSPRATYAFALLGAACALVPAVAMWGFTVDDALIPVRYAHNVATGAGYRFDAGGPSTDGVTPLPWAFILAPLARSSSMATLLRAKELGVVAWTIAGGVLGARVDSIVRKDGRARRALAAASFVVLALAFPVGAWASSGLETGVVTAIATIAAARLGVGRRRSASVIAGVAAAFRPELVVWAIVVGAGDRLIGRRGGDDADVDRDANDDFGNDDVRVDDSVRIRGAAMRGLVGAAIAALPFTLVAAVRLAVFGRAAPLAVFAKPSDLAHGAVYALAAALVVLTPLVAAGPWVLAKGKQVAIARVLILAFVAHGLAVIAAGGDWMPYARLMVPVAPSLVIASAFVVRHAKPAWSVARAVVSLSLGIWLAVKAAPAGRRVGFDRADLVARATPVLEGAKVVAALDVGWVSASTNARIVDLAGLTDPQIALLPGGHTSKRVDVSMLLDRDVDVLVAYSTMRVVESRIVHSDAFASRFVAAEQLPVGTQGAFYTVYRRR